MTDVEQFLADLEAKAKAATPGIWEKHCDTKYGYATIDIDGVCEFIQAYTSSPNRYDNAAFIAAANPAAVLRLVSMVRWLAEQIREDDGGSKAWIQAAYHATEPNHD